MSLPSIHPNWDLPPKGMTDGYSLEITAKDIDALREAAPAMAPETPVAVTFLPGESLEARIEAARTVRALGFEPMPHFSARRLESGDDFEAYLAAVVREAGVTRCFIIAGDPPEAAGPYSDSMSLIRTGAFERAGIKAIGVGGHPEGHPNMTPDQCFDILIAKCAEIEARVIAQLQAVVQAFAVAPCRDLRDGVEGRGAETDLGPVR